MDKYGHHHSRHDAFSSKFEFLADSFTSTVQFIEPSCLHLLWHLGPPLLWDFRACAPCMQP